MDNIVLLKTIANITYKNIKFKNKILTDYIILKKEYEKIYHNNHYAMESAEKKLLDIKHKIQAISYDKKMFKKYIGYFEDIIFKKYHLKKYHLKKNGDKYHSNSNDYLIISSYLLYHHDMCINRANVLFKYGKKLITTYNIALRTYLEIFFVKYKEKLMRDFNKKYNILEFDIIPELISWKKKYNLFLKNLGFKQKMYIYCKQHTFIIWTDSKLSESEKIRRILELKLQKNFGIITDYKLISDINFNVEIDETDIIKMVLNIIKCDTFPIKWKICNNKISIFEDNLTLHKVNKHDNKNTNKIHFLKIC